MREIIERGSERKRERRERDRKSVENGEFEWRERRGEEK